MVKTEFTSAFDPMQIQLLGLSKLKLSEEKIWQKSGKSAKTKYVSIVLACVQAVWKSVHGSGRGSLRYSSGMTYVPGPHRGSTPRFCRI